jgi:hypothetical protein
MKQVSHPYTNDKPVLTEEYTSLGVWHFNVERTAKYRRAGLPYKVRELFATVRPAINSGGLWDTPTKGVVVLRNNFDEIREFPDFFTAKQYIEALFALEFAAG